MKAELKEAISKAEESIKKAIRQNGPYSHNIIGFALRDLADKHGNEKANALVDKFKLDKLYGFNKE